MFTFNACKDISLYRRNNKRTQKRLFTLQHTENQYIANGLQELVFCRVIVALSPPV